MEPNGEGKRGASALRRLRISCPKDSADAEARLDETPLIEKFRKGNLQTFPVSFAAPVGSTAAPAWSKKKRYVLQETQTLLERTDGGNSSVERAKTAPSEEEGDEAALLPSFTPFGRSKSKERAKEDELVMNISNIPRRARSSGSRLSSLRRQVEHSFTLPSSQQAPTVYQQRSPFPKLLMKRPVGRKNRPLKDFRAMESPQISDQEVEVAEVLFDLSRSVPSVVKSSNLRCQENSGRVMEDEERDSSSSQAVGSSASEHVQKSSSPSLDEPKRKRQRGSVKQEEASEVVAAGIGPVGLGELGKNQDASGEECKQKRRSGVMVDPCYGDSQLQAMHDKNGNYPEQRSKEIAKTEVMKSNNAKHTFGWEDLVPSGPTICKDSLCVQISCKNGDHSKPSIRSREDQQANGSKSKADLVHLTKNFTPEDKGGDAMETNIKKPSLSEIPDNFSRNRVKSFPGMRDKVSKGNIILGTPAADVENTGRVLPGKGTQQRLEQMSGQVKEEQNDLKVLDINKENDVRVLDQGAHSACLSRCTLPSPTENCSTSIGFPPWSIHAKVTPPWSTKAFLLGSNLGRKVPYPTTQVPRTTAQPVLKRRRCATHVFVAHYIQQRQQFLRQTFWPLACPSGAAYHSSTLASNLQGNESKSDKNAHLPSMQAGWAPLGESRGIKMSNSKGLAPSNFLHECSVGAGTAAHVGDATAYGIHDRYHHAMRQQHHCASLYMPSNKSPRQPHFQLKQQGQEQQQQQHYTAIWSQNHGAGPDGFSGGDQMLSTGEQSIRLHQQALLQGQQAAFPSDTLLLHRLNRGAKVEDVNVLAEENDFSGILCEDKAAGGPAQPDLATSALAATGHGGYDQQLQNLGTQHQYCYQRSYPKVPPSTSSTTSHCNKEQGSIECQPVIKQAGSSTDGSKAMESHLPMSVTNGDPSPIHQATLLPNSHHIQKQAMAFVKPVKPATGSNTTAGSSVETTAGASVEDAFTWGNVAKIPSVPQRTISSSQNVVNASHMLGCSNGSHASSRSPEQQVWSNLQSAANWVPHNDFSSRPSSGTFSCAVPQSSSVVVARNSSLSNKCCGEGLGRALQGNVTRKTATAGNPNSGEKASTRVDAEAQGHSQCQTMFPQQQSMNLQQTRHQVYHQPYPPSSNKDEQLPHQPQLQQQSRASQAQLFPPRLEIQSPLQQSHLQKQLHFVPSNVSLSNGLLPSATLGTILQGKTTTGTSIAQTNNEK